MLSAEEEGKEVTEEDLDDLERGYIDRERRAHLEGVDPEALGQLNDKTATKESLVERDRKQGRVVDVVLSDMSEPWPLMTGYGKRSLSDPYYRMMNTSGMPFRDHAGSMVSLHTLLHIYSSSTDSGA